MNYHYTDITDKLGEPLWWDEYAVPRYCVFTPDVVADIYAREAVLAEISCQACDYRFKVAFSSSMLGIINGNSSLKDKILDKIIHYGDPPNNGCCSVGASMNSSFIKVMEFWERSEHTNFLWKRKNNFEGVLTHKKENY